MFGNINLRFNIRENMSATLRKETLQEYEHRLKYEAKELSLKFKDIKATKYLLK